MSHRAARRSHPAGSAKGGVSDRPGTELVEIAGSLSGAALDWAGSLAGPLVEGGGGRTPVERHWERLDGVEGVSAYAIVWPPGSSVGFHDHGGTAGAMAVVRGTLHETIVLCRPGRRFWTRTHAVHAGEHVTFDRSHVHRVANSDEIRALRVHVYGPRLRSMTHFAPPDLVGLSALYTEWF